MEIGLAIIVGLPVLVVIVGLMLPAATDMVGTVRLAVPPDVLWQRLLDGEHYPVSCAMARGVEVQPTEHAGPAWLEDIGHSKVQVRTLEADPPRRLVRSLGDTTVSMSAQWTFSILPDGEGSLVSLENHTIVDRGTWQVPFFRVMTRVFGAARKGMEQYVRSLAGGEDLQFDWS
ncbi:SRPBCC family protein [Engelhardtia mirabilis]|uniref:Polyketide cyclase / dehydrase and lipid transport n=1 Tax=Engelhardtia mirabilis TaxID=2528011 RepID=A0A518BS85_9BACT|nr:hypothetical protein Pla133_49520 [Planctomycetes bacterium Pla133]QDV04156.1 hypothetical protein Pla86_49500 [Planctomycetes bacterium Pla86]